jgi:hypothetical protein
LAFGLAPVSEIERRNHREVPLSQERNGRTKWQGREQKGEHFQLLCTTILRKDTNTLGEGAMFAVPRNAVSSNFLLKLGSFHFPPCLGPILVELCHWGFLARVTTIVLVAVACIINILLIRVQIILIRSNHGHFSLVNVLRT